jgi:antitoxin component HigA of HigAB toxin-antitoxin module
MIYLFSAFKQNLSSQFFEVDIENPLGESALAKIESYLFSLYREDTIQTREPTQVSSLGT